MGTFPSILQAEIYAIERCVQLILDRNYRKQEITILSDSQAALKAINSVSINSKLVKECIEKLNKLAKENKVLLHWVPAHQGIEGNEKANNLARKGANTPLTEPEPFCFSNGNQLKAELKNLEDSIRNLEWVSSNCLRLEKVPQNL